jgi:putative DNA primase/helicase
MAPQNNLPINADRHSGKTGLDDFAVACGDHFLHSISGLIATAGVVSPDLRKLTSTANGGNGGRPPVVKTIADACADSLRDKSGMLTLRSYRGSWWKYNGAVYRELPQSDVESQIMGWLREYQPDYATPNMLRSILANLAASDLCGVSSTACPPCWIDERACEQLLLTSNAIIRIDRLIDALAGKLMDHHDIFSKPSPLLFATSGLPYAYDPFAACPRWEAYVKSALPCPEDQCMLQALFGLALVHDTRFNVFFLLWGTGGNGKSVAVETLRHLVGADNCCAVPLSQIGERFALYPLTLKSLNLVGDQSESTSPMAEALLKDITGGGSLKVERKGIDVETRPATARCIFTGNHFPRFSDTSTGLWDRMRVIYFSQCFRDTTAEIPFLESKIIDHELPGVLNWALRGLVWLRSLPRFPESPDAVAVKAEKRNHADSARAFLVEMAEAAPDNTIPTAVLYNHYMDYCFSHGLKSQSMAELAARVQSLYTGVRKQRVRDDSGSQVFSWLGLRLK